MAQVKRVRGIDIYHGDGTLDWPQVYAGGCKFAFVKATQGTTVTDSAYARNVREARAAGLYVGAYHFLRQHEGGVEQAKHFLETVGNGRRGMLVPTVDVEGYGNEPWELSATDTTRKVLAFIAHIQQVTGRGCIVYTSPGFAGDHLNSDVYEDSGHRYALAHYPLWVAHYGVEKPRVPKPWAAWTFWQHGEAGTVQGCPYKGTTDTDWYAGDVAGLEKLVVRS